MHKDLDGVVLFFVWPWSHHQAARPKPGPTTDTPMPLLPSVRVKRGVGLTTFSVPAQPRSFRTAKHQDGSPALHLDYITWNVFYPCDLTGATKHEYGPVPWLESWHL